MADTAFGGLTPRQKRMVALYTSEGKKLTYLNRIASYEACYSTNQNKASRDTAAYRLFKKQEIQEAIKELLPSNAYDALFIRDEYLAHYEEAKEEGSRKDCLTILKEMAAHEGMLTKKKEVTETSTDKKELEDMQNVINENFRKRSAEMKGDKDGTKTANQA